MGDPVPSREAAERPARLKVGVIGAGRVGTVLGAALERAGHQVMAVSAVSDRSLERAGRLLPGAVVMRPPELLAAVDLALLTVPDDALPGLVSGLAATEAPLAGRLMAHTSGRHGIAVLEPATVRGALPLALHPVMTFTGRPDDLDRLTGISFGVTAPGAAAARGAGAGHRDGRRARAHRRGVAPAVSRRAGQRGQSPGRAGGPVGRRARARPG